MSNKEVLIRVGEDRTMISLIVKRKKNWIGHVLRLERRRFVEGCYRGKNGWKARERKDENKDAR